MPKPFIAGIRIFVDNFAPRGLAFCDGWLLPTGQSAELFSPLWTTYGGDGTTTFALPNIASHAPMHAGQGSGLSNRQLGQSGGTETVTLTEAQMPQHNHLVHATDEDAETQRPSGKLLATTGEVTYATPGADATMAPQMLDNTSGSAPPTTIGTALIQEVLAEAGKPVRIHVEQFNPARRLYARLGFSRIGNTSVYDLLERRR